jgi:hypothetical protein
MRIYGYWQIIHDIGKNYLKITALSFQAGNDNFN